MGFSLRRYLGLLSIALLGARIAAGASGDQDKLGITVLVVNGARVSPSVLNRAELEAARIFRAAGIEMAWVDCSGGAEMVEDMCHVSPGPKQFVLHIVPNGTTSTDSVFGLSFIGEDGTGKYSDVFFDRIAEAHRQFGFDVEQLLGTVAAHELGHLLLGTQAHSHGGIMAPAWGSEILREVGMGNLWFTGEQSSRMRARICGAGVRVASFGPRWRDR